MISHASFNLEFKTGKSHLYYKLNRCLQEGILSNTFLALFYVFLFLFTHFFINFCFSSWKEAVEVKGSDGFCMMKQLLEKLPDVAKVTE